MLANFSVKYKSGHIFDNDFEKVWKFWWNFIKKGAIQWEIVNSVVVNYSRKGSFGENKTIKGVNGWEGVLKRGLIWPSISITNFQWVPPLPVTVYLGWSFEMVLKFLVLPTSSFAIVMDIYHWSPWATRPGYPFSRAACGEKGCVPAPVVINKSKDNLI